MSSTHTSKTLPGCLMLVVVLVVTQPALAMNDPVTGRWLTRDPIRTQGGPNMYLYLNPNPLQWADPHGLLPVTILPPNPIDPFNLPGHGGITDCPNCRFTFAAGSCQAVELSPSHRDCNCGPKWRGTVTATATPEGTITTRADTVTLTDYGPNPTPCEVWKLGYMQAIQSCINDHEAEHVNIFQSMFAQFSLTASGSACSMIEACDKAFVTAMDTIILETQRRIQIGNLAHAELDAAQSQHPLAPHNCIPDRAGPAPPGCTFAP